MCGITGFYNLKNDKDDAQCLKIAQAMEQAIAHRGPDGNDIWADPELPLVLAHRRLAIIDLSDDGRQPMASPTGRYMVVYNGEIYNYLELQKELEAQGRQFKSRSDTEVMLAAFEHWGINQALQKINGMFAIVLWDRKERRLHFIRDRFGKKPLYVGWAGNDLVFASELKSFHAHPDFAPEINHDALAIYMHYGYLQAPYSIFKNVWQMLPAGRMTIDVSSLKSGADLSAQMEIYWSLKSVAQNGLSRQIAANEHDIIEEFELKFQTAVNQRMISDVPFGAFLSGGIDSSGVVALMQKNASVPVKTFSIGFKESAFNEAQYAKQIAKHLETDHQEFYVTGQDALDVIPNLADIYDEPFSDQSQIPTYLISKLARDQVTVVLTGDGGDEILGGYDRHTKIPALWSKTGWVPYALRKPLMAILSSVPESFYGALKS
ncbi:MAG TPA: asparagine synthase (glutamine-hydrolyzing), partial [Alphaproteobacteria bacterium]|nr:asparagine synthase (glutamine-hydrolyzing) [Alphaproteobacteria bacterium]